MVIIKMYYYWIKQVIQKIPIETSFHIIRPVKETPMALVSPFLDNPPCITPINVATSGWVINAMPITKAVAVFNKLLVVVI